MCAPSKLVYTVEKTNVCRVNRPRYMAGLSSDHDEPATVDIFSLHVSSSFSTKKKSTIETGRVSLLMNVGKSFSLRESGQLPFFSTA